MPHKPKSKPYNTIHSPQVGCFPGSGSMHYANDYVKLHSIVNDIDHILEANPDTYVLSARVTHACINCHSRYDCVNDRCSF